MFGVEDAEDEDVPPSGASGRPPGIEMTDSGRDCGSHVLEPAAGASCGGPDVSVRGDGGSDFVVSSVLSVAGAVVVEAGGGRSVGCGTDAKSARVLSVVDAAPPAIRDWSPMAG